MRGLLLFSANLVMELNMNFFKELETGMSGCSGFMAMIEF